MSDYQIRVITSSHKKPLTVIDRGDFTLGDVIKYLSETSQWIYQPALFFEGSDDQLQQLRGLEAVLGMEPSPVVQTTGIIESFENYIFDSLYLAVVVIPNEI